MNAGNRPAREGMSFPKDELARTAAAAADAHGSEIVRERVRAGVRAAIEAPRHRPTGEIGQ